MLYVWGCGQFGQHGHGHTRNVPAKNGSLELRSGCEKNEEVIKLISCGASHSIALTEDNRLYAWGNNGTEQLGLIAKQHVYLKPVPIPPASYAAHEEEIVGISCGSRQSFMWTKSGKYFCYGSCGTAYSKMCDENENTLNTPLTSSLGDLRVRQISCGSVHVVFCLQDGRCMTLGSNNRGQLGVGTKDEAKCPITIENIDAAVIHVACGNMHTLCMTENNELFSWGYGPACGMNNDADRAMAIEFEEKQSKLVKLQGGDSHSMALASDGRVFVWGSNNEGQLGKSTSNDLVKKPILMTEIREKGECVDISARDDTSAAVMKTGQVYLWGKNLWGVLEGDNSSGTTNSGTIRQVTKVDFKEKGEIRAQKISLGSWHVGIIASRCCEEQAEEDDTEKVLECKEPDALLEPVSKVEVKMLERNLEDNEERFPGDEISCRIQLPEDVKDLNNNADEKNPMMAVNAAGVKNKNQNRVCTSNRSFSTASFSPLNHTANHRELISICHFVNISNMKSVTRQKQRDSQDTTKSNEDNNGNAGGQNNDQVNAECQGFGKSLSHDETFITQIQPRRSPLRTRYFKQNFQEMKTSTWSTEAFLSADCVGCKPQCLSNITDAPRPFTARTRLPQQIRSFERSKTMEIVPKQQTLQLPKLQDQKLANRSPRFNRFNGLTEDRKSMFIQGSSTRSHSAVQQRTFHRKKLERTTSNPVCIASMGNKNTRV
eukprot:gene498-1144_t